MRIRLEYRDKCWAVSAPEINISTCNYNALDLAICGVVKLIEQYGQQLYDCTALNYDAAWDLPPNVGEDMVIAFDAVLLKNTCIKISDTPETYLAYRRNPAIKDGWGYKLIQPVSDTDYECLQAKLKYESNCDRIIELAHGLDGWCVITTQSISMPHPSANAVNILKDIAKQLVPQSIFRSCDELAYERIMTLPNNVANTWLKDLGIYKPMPLHTWVSINEGMALMKGTLGIYHLIKANYAPEETL